MVLATTAQLLRRRSNPSRAQTILLGVVLRLLALAKLFIPDLLSNARLGLGSQTGPMGLVSSAMELAVLATCIAMLRLPELDGAARGPRRPRPPQETAVCTPGMVSSTATASPT